MTSGNSTPRALARWRTRIQPDAIATSGSGSRRDQRSVVAAGGASTIQPVTGGKEAYPDPVDRDGFAIVERLQRPSRQLAVTRLHDRDRAWRREHALVAWPGVVAVPVRDDGALHREQRVDMEAARHAI